MDYRIKSIVPLFCLGNTLSIIIEMTTRHRKEKYRNNRVSALLFACIPGNGYPQVPATLSLIDCAYILQARRQLHINLLGNE